MTRYRVNHHCSGMYLINLTNDHNRTKYYGPECLKERVTPVHIFFGGGGQGEVEIRYLNNTVVPVTMESGRWPILFDCMILGIGAFACLQVLCILILITVSRFQGVVWSGCITLTRRD